MKKDRSKPIGILVLILGAVVMAGIFLYSKHVTENAPKNFERSKKNLAEKLYNGVIDYDLENDYPQQPLDVMLLYDDTIVLLYGGMIINDEYLRNVIRVQRQLWTDELLETTTEEEQLKNLKESLDILYGQGVTMTRIEVGSTIYDPLDSNICIVKTSQYATKLNRLDWDYYLYKDENEQWKVGNWRLTSY